MAKQRGYPDHRGMGAQSDFISETFVPSASYQANQAEIARALIAAGLSPTRVAAMLSVSPELCEDDATGRNGASGAAAQGLDEGEQIT